MNSGFANLAKQLGRWSVFVAVMALNACGGGNDSAGTSGATPVLGSSEVAPVAGTTTPTVAVSPSIDSALQAYGALVIANTMTTVETRPMGISIASRGDTDSVIYALDNAGEVALAANAVNGRATFSAEGTVLALGSAVLETISPTATLEQIQSRLRSAQGYAALVSDISAAVLAGKNPLNETAVQQGFDKVLTSAASATSVQTKGVAKRYADDEYESSILETSMFKVSLANKSQNELKFDSKVYLRNTSSLFFTAALIDLSDAQYTSASLKGAGASISPLVSIEPMKIDKPFSGSFFVRLLVDDQKNKAELVKGALKFTKLFSDDCLGKFAELASTQVVNAYFNATPDDWLLEVLKDGAWTAVTEKECLLQYVAPKNIIPIVTVYGKISQTIGFGRLVSDRLALPEDIPDTGVCLSEYQYQMSCVASISATALKPMMPNAVQPIDIRFMDEKGRKTAPPPFGLDIKYSNPGLFKISSTFNQVIAEGLEGTGDVTLTDPATGKKLSFGVKVTKGKLDRSAYTVANNGSVTMELIDPVSGLEVYRQPATFDIALKDGKYGKFLYDPYIGPITFQASDTATPSPQAILLNKFESGFFSTVESGSTLQITATQKVTEPGTAEVVDWTSSTTGKLGSISISISAVGTPPRSDPSLFGGSVVSRIFSSGHFAGPVSLVKAIEVFGKSQQVTNTYTVTFSTPVTDVRVHLGSLASVVTFNQPVTRLSGQSSFSVTGSTVTGAVDNSDSLTDSNGTIGLSGTLNSFSFTTVGLPNVGLADGIAMQISARP